MAALTHMCGSWLICAHRGALDGAKFTGLPASFLGSIRVSVTGTRQKKPDVGKRYTVYKVHVECDGGRWEVQHRYSKLREVSDLQAPVSSSDPAGVPSW